MKSIADHAEGRIREFEATDFSSTAWSLATLEFQHEALRAAIAEQVMIKVSCLGVQQLGSLADLKLGWCSHKTPHFLAQACGIASDAPCSKSDEFSFGSHVLHAVYHRDAFGFSRNAPTRMCRGINHDDLDIIRKFVEQMPTSLDSFQRKFSKLVEEVDADTCGIWGDQLLLKLLGISSASEDFNQKAARLVLKYHQQNLSNCFRGENLLHQRRICEGINTHTHPSPAMDSIRYTYMKDTDAPMPRRVEPQIDELIREEMAPSKQRRLDPRDTRKRKISEFDAALERWKDAAETFLPKEPPCWQPSGYEIEHWRRDAAKRLEDDIQRQNDQAQKHLADCGAFLAEVMKGLDFEESQGAWQEAKGGPLTMEG
eukprot:symbB.v1.2.006431.t2/scaffold384.1/size215671/4